MKPQNARDETFCEITVLGKPALFTRSRIDKNTVPRGLYKYDVRCDEYTGDVSEIAEEFHNDHFGTIITAERIKLDKFGRYKLKKVGDWLEKPFNGMDECVGSIVYYDPAGNVCGVYDYDDEKCFRKDVLEELKNDVTISLIIYCRTAVRRSMSLHWLSKTHPCLKEVRTRRYPKLPCKYISEFSKRYRNAETRKF